MKKEIEKQSNLISDMKLENDQNTDNYNKEIESFKFRNMQLELELKDKTGNFEKEKLLFESKYKFFENQLNQSKKDLAEYQKKFETTLETLQKKSFVR